MKLGLLTAAFPDLDLETICKWASANDFKSVEIAMWKKGKVTRRYAGVTHIDSNILDDNKAKEILAMIKSYGLTISALAYYPNPLDPDKQKAHEAIEHIKTLIDSAVKLNVEILGTFIGKDKNKTVEENLTLFKEVWKPIVKYAKERNIKIAIENCPMIFSYDEWPGGNNLASTPVIWEKMFNIISDDNFGLNLDPSHLVLQMIDIPRVIKDFGSKIFHIHAKDLMIDKEGLYKNGVFSLGMGWQIPRLPGLGDVNWKEFFSSLYRAKYNGFVSIEHEDRDFEGSEELVKKGFLLARDNIKQFIV